MRPSCALKRPFHSALGRVRVAIGTEKVFMAHLQPDPVQDLLHGDGLLLGKWQWLKPSRSRVAHEHHVPRALLSRALRRLVRHAQRRGHAQDVALDQEAPMRVDERGPRHLRQLLVRHDQHLLGAREVLFHRRHQRHVELAQQRPFARLVGCRLTPTLVELETADFTLAASP